MPSQNNVHIALLSAYAIVLHSLEALIPTPIPWLRLGLANIITLATLIMHGFRAGMMVTLIRVFVGSMITGTFLGPAFILSLGGGVSSTLAMGAVRGISGRIFGPIGFSLLGAITHNLAQLFLAYLLFVRNLEAIIFISPIILLIGTITGTFNGIATSLLLKRLENTVKQ